MTEQMWVAVLSMAGTGVLLGVTFSNRDWVGMGWSIILLGLQIAALGGM